MNVNVVECKRKYISPTLLNLADLKMPVAIVTGGNKGIGLGVVRNIKCSFKSFRGEGAVQAVQGGGLPHRQGRGPRQGEAIKCKSSMLVQRPKLISNCCLP